jgi:hypothetical protein
LNVTGNGLIYSTYLGGSDSDEGYGIAVDTAGNAYITGRTSSTDFPTINPYQTDQAVYDVFVFKFHEDFDDEPPIIQLNGFGNNSILSSKYVYSLQISEQVSLLDEVLYNWDNAENQTLKAPYQFSPPIGDGTHTLFVYGSDSAGNWNSQILIFEVDDTPPIVLLQSPFDGAVGQSKALISLEVTDLNLDTVYYNWDGNPNQTLNVPFQTSFPAGDGPHTLYVYAVDTVGNWVSSIYSFTTDDTEPQIQLAEFNNGTVLKSNTEIQLNITDENDFQIFYNWDSTGANTTLLEQYILLPAGDGQHLLNIYVQDIAGNWALANYSFITDDTPPSINFADPNQSDILQSEVIIDFTVDDLHNISAVMYKWDEALSYDTFTHVSDIDTPLGDGNHTLSILARDDLGNEIEVSFEFIVDNTVPTLEVSGINQLAILMENTTVDVTASDINGIVKVEFYLDLDLVSTQTGPEYSLIINPENFENKQYDLQVWVYDPAGNIAKSEVIKFNVNNEVETTPATDGTNIPPEAIYAILGVSGIGLSGLLLRFIRGRRFDRALDNLEDQFTSFEDTKEGKE